MPIPRRPVASAKEPKLSTERISLKMSMKMCDHHQFQAQSSTGNIEHVHYLSENIGELFLKPDYSDVILKVEKKSFHAHKVILAARSEYFRALLFGGMMESRPDFGEVELKDANAEAFRHLLKYIYTGRMSLSELKEETLLDVLGLAHQFGFVELETAISDHLKAVLDVRNVCLIYDIASMYSLRTLCQTCFEFMDRNATEVIKSSAFLSLSGDALKDIVRRDSFCAPEIAIFNAVAEWSERNPDERLAAIMEHVRLPLMSLDDLLQHVRPSGLVPADAILDAIKVQTASRNTELNFRGILTPGENVAQQTKGASVLRGEMKAALLDENTVSYDLDHGFTRHAIDDNNGQGIVVKLAAPYIINTIKMLLWDRDIRSYSYYIEVSMDDVDYVRIIDHTKYLCRAWQHLRFQARVCKYIRIVGTHNTVNRVFHLVSFECKYSKQPFKLESGILIPTENVATVNASACVIEGVSRSRNALINGDTKDYDWDSGYTCHQLGSGAIIVQLAQPYMIDSMRLLLWDCDRRSYSYYVEVSTDQHSWTMVADKTKEACRSWQTLRFKRQPVTFIKLVGTHNTANDVFHCVHFECPANIESSLSDDDSEPTAPVPPAAACRSATPEGGTGGGAAALGGDPLAAGTSSASGRSATGSQGTSGRGMNSQGMGGQGASGSGNRNPFLHAPSDSPSPPNRPATAVVDHGDGYGMENMDLGARDGRGGGAGSSSGSERSVSPALTS